MSKNVSQAKDALIDQVRETRQRLVAEHGGLQGWVKYLQERQKEHPERLLPSPKSSITQT